MRRGRARQRALQGLETRRRLLEVSLRLFVRQGYAGTTVRDIAGAARVSVGLMFHYFPSKQALLQEHARSMRHGIAAVARLLAAGGPPLDRFTTVARTVLQSLGDESTRQLFLLVNQVLMFESVPRSVRRLVSSTSSIDASVPLIRSGQRRGLIKRGDPRALAVAFWGALQGIAEVLVWYPTASIPSPESVVDILRARPVLSVRAAPPRDRRSRREAPPAGPRSGAA